MLAFRAVEHVPSVRRIELLPPDVANQIAAGEVVERPASIVKELVENALDAGATSVTLTVDHGGIARIAVTDDGAGMDTQDLALAVVRHATSKIRTAQDLVGVATYGFRGEALPSIASVSKLRITSRTRDSDEGAEVILEGGGEAKVRVVGCATGTTVSVEELFFNTPARRKFLRTAQTESAACLDALVRLALPRPDVKFVVRRDGKVVRELLRHDDVIHRAREIWRDEPLADVRGERGPIRVTALLGPPERARVGTSALALYVNGRSVRDRVLLRAVAQAYGSTLAGGRYPVGGLLLEVPAEEVDVNVHPQKSEVRFARQSEVFAALMSVLRDGLNDAPWARATASFGDPWAQRFRGGPAAEVTAPPATGSLFRTGPVGQPVEPPTVERSAWTGSAPEQGGDGNEVEVARALRAFVASTSTSEPDPWGLAPQPPYPPASYEDQASARVPVTREPAAVAERA
ncbi:MAG: DNA mismatch repair endonuclease MutL, partial [Deltaproteobacteria bacterium]